MALQLFKIASVTVGSGGASTIAFSSIPQGYTDLKIIISSRSPISAFNMNTLLTFNGTTSGYSEKMLYGNGSSAASASNSGSNIVWSNDANGATSTSNTFNNNEIYIPNYTSGNYKSLSIDNVVENNATGGFQIMLAGLWSNTAAITSITLTASTTTFAQYSTATLYGIL
jgi:hypothetical protein